MIIHKYRPVLLLGFLTILSKCDSQFHMGPFPTGGGMGDVKPIKSEAKDKDVKHDKPPENPALQIEKIEQYKIGEKIHEESIKHVNGYLPGKSESSNSSSMSEIALPADTKENITHASMPEVNSSMSSSASESATKPAVIIESTEKPKMDEDDSESEEEEEETTGAPGSIVKHKMHTHKHKDGRPHEHLKGKEGHGKKKKHHQGGRGFGRLPGKSESLNGSSIIVVPFETNTSIVSPVINTTAQSDPVKTMTFKPDVLIKVSTEKPLNDNISSSEEVEEEDSTLGLKKHNHFPHEHEHKKNMQKHPDKQNGRAFFGTPVPLLLEKNSSMADKDLNLTDIFKMLTSTKPEMILQNVTEKIIASTPKPDLMLTTTSMSKPKLFKPTIKRVFFTGKPEILPQTNETESKPGSTPKPEVKVLATEKPTAIIHKTNSTPITKGDKPVNISAIIGRSVKTHKKIRKEPKSDDKEKSSSDEKSTDESPVKPKKSVMKHKTTKTRKHEKMQTKRRNQSGRSFNINEMRIKAMKLINEESDYDNGQEPIDPDENPQDEFDITDEDLNFEDKPLTYNDKQPDVQRQQPQPNYNPYPSPSLAGPAPLAQPPISQPPSIPGMEGPLGWAPQQPVQQRVALTPAPIHWGPQPPPMKGQDGLQLTSSEALQLMEKIQGTSKDQKKKDALKAMRKKYKILYMTIKYKNKNNNGSNGTSPRIPPPFAFMQQQLQQQQEKEEQERLKNAKASTSEVGGCKSNGSGEASSEESKDPKSKRKQRKQKETRKKIFKMEKDLREIKENQKRILTLLKKMSSKKEQDSESYEDDAGID